MNNNQQKQKYINTDLKEDINKLNLLLINFDLPAENKQLYINNQINLENLVWLNSNLTIQNKKNIKLHETLRLIQRILKKLK